MSKSQDVQDILEEWLKSHKYDGLVSDDAECGCSLDDLAPCCESFLSCCPGYRGPDPTGECDFLIYHTREAAEAGGNDG